MREVREELGVEVTHAAFLCDTIKPRPARADLYIGFFSCALQLVDGNGFSLSSEHDSYAWILPEAAAWQVMPEPYRRAIRLGCGLEL